MPFGSQAVWRGRRLLTSMHPLALLTKHKRCNLDLQPFLFFFSFFGAQSLGNIHILRLAHILDTQAGSTMSKNDELLTDDYVADLLSQEASDCSLKYSAMGMEAYRTNKK